MKILGLMLLSLFLLSGCQSGDSTTAPTPDPIPQPPPSQDITFLFNQIGFLPGQTKLILIEPEQQIEFSVVSTQTGQTVLSGTTTASGVWPVAAEQVAIADLSALTTPGEYRVRLADGTESAPFTIGTAAFEALHDASIKAFYFNRASTSLDAQYAGQWQRNAGHPDDKVKVHSSAATAGQPEDTEIDSAKGWYDAGDYNKYIVNSGISMHTLMRAYLDSASFYQDRTWNILESANAQDDLLDEIRWNLDWVLTMQDPEGGVYHKLTHKNFSGIVMPEDATAPRYVVAQSTSAALNFAAMVAQAARIVPEQKTAMLAQAISAWQWAVANPDQYYTNPDDVSTGQYGDVNLADEFAWAAAELYLSTEDDSYLAQFWQYKPSLQVPSWANTTALAVYSLLNDSGDKLSQTDRDNLVLELKTLADSIVTTHQQSSFRVAMEESDFVWGSNSVAMNKGILLWQAWRWTGNQQYKDAAIGLLDYVLGRNPLDMSFVTGFGTRSPMNIHHRQSAADGVTAPVPGWLVGGPQNGQQDGCSYSSNLPSKSYLDDWCSYSTNEVTINWNAPLVYLLSVVLNP